MAVTAIVVGAGNRGRKYAAYAEVAPDQLKIVGVAEPIEALRVSTAAKYEIKKEMCWNTWEKILDYEKVADIAIITTQDQMHKEPAIKLSEKGYHILLEKPMAVTYEDCKAIVEAVMKSGVMFGVCHVLRYYPQYLQIRELIDARAIGEVRHIQHTEPVGFWRYAHSYVRGNWRKESESSSSLLAKCCHDLDLVAYWMGESRCTKISSFGSLMHFTRENKPKDAGNRCFDCPIEGSCAYSARKIYENRAKEGNFSWPVSVLCKGKENMEELMSALQTGPYGRCVYDCDNDVMSNQVVNMQFSNGATATLSMVAFTERIWNRQTVIYGTKGEITCDYYGPVTVFDFLTREKRDYHVDSKRIVELAGQGGAAYHLVKTFIGAVIAGDQSRILTGPDDALYSHRLVFEAEKSRRENCIVQLE